MTNVITLPDGTPIMIPDELLNTPINKWQLNGVTITIALFVLGRAYIALRNGGGLMGVFRGIVYGTNTPTKPTEE